MDPLQRGDPVSVGSYRLLGRLGAGGMGQVFLGVSPGGRKVAVKVIHPVHAGNAQFRERFAREIEAAQRVGGFHTAPVVDADPHADPPWMVTAFIEGLSLQMAVDQDGPMTADRVRALGAGLAEGLAAIHARGLVHRDLKPGNVILAPDGPRIIDFGIARVIDASTGITMAGAVIGTFAYMSPEHLGGDAAGPASDVFSLGSVLAFAALGRPPFAGDSAATVMFRLVSHPPDLAGLADQELAGLIGDCLAKAPEARPTVSSLLAALGRPAPEPLREDAPVDVGPAADAGDAPTTTPPPTPPETGPEREARPSHRLPAAATTRPRRWPAPVIAAVVLVVALAVTLPFLLSTGAPQAAGGHRSDAAAGLGSTAASPDRGRPSPTAGRHSWTVRPTASRTIAGTSPAVQPDSSPASSSSPASLRSPAGPRSPASSKGPQGVTIPNVIGLTINQAIQKLESYGFVVVVVQSSTGSFHPNRVTGYSPTGKAPLGSAITIYI